MGLLRGYCGAYVVAVLRPVGVVVLLCAGVDWRWAGCVCVVGLGGGGRTGVGYCGLVWVDAGGGWCCGLGAGCGGVEREVVRVVYGWGWVWVVWLCGVCW